MNQDFEKELRRAEREKEQARRVESFWDAFRLTENGHVKSTLLLNSFCLSILFLAVYGAAFFLLTDPIHAWLALAPPDGRKSGQRAAPRPDRDSNLRADPPDLPSSDRSGRIRLALAAGPRQSGDHAAPAAGDSGASVLFLQLFGMMVPVPLLMGFGSSWWLLRRRNSL